jgi:hypothetical protein
MYFWITNTFDLDTRSLTSSSAGSGAVSAPTVKSDSNLRSCSTVLNRVTPHPRFRSFGLNTHMFCPLNIESLSKYLLYVFAFGYRFGCIMIALLMSCKESNLFFSIAL